MRRFTFLVAAALLTACCGGPAGSPQGTTTGTSSASPVSPPVAPTGSTTETTATVETVPPTALSQSGSLDEGFGAAGLVVTAVGSGDDIANTVILQPDGRMITVGLTSNGSDYDVLLVRYNGDGSLDSEFGAGGKVTTPIGPANDWAWDGALQPDGKIITAGFASNGTDLDVALVRYNTDGSLDPTFGVGGKVTTPIGPADDQAHAVVVQPDGKIVAAGWVSYETDYETRREIALVRYTAEGSLDSSFGAGGKVTAPIGSLGSQAYDVVVQPDGRIVVAGVATDWGASGMRDFFALARYTAAGSLDTSFGVGGRVMTAIGPGEQGGDQAYAVVLQPDGRIVAVGRTDVPTPFHVAVARYNADGSLDPTFGAGGKVTTAITSSQAAGARDEAESVAIQPDGRIVVAGFVSNGASDAFALARFNVDGSLDAAFGQHGTVTTAIGSTSDVASAVAVQPDGRIIAAGVTTRGTNYDIALARYRG